MKDTFNKFINKALFNEYNNKNEILKKFITEKNNYNNYKNMKYNEEYKKFFMNNDINKYFMKKDRDTNINNNYILYISNNNYKYDISNKELEEIFNLTYLEENDTNDRLKKIKP